MKEVNCDVIRDLLPLYEDGAVSEETAELVRTHLKDCPACREELRKMRTPISLPPEEDEDLWKKFAEKKARLRKKRNIRLACIALALAVFALFSLWYTRPVSTEQVMKGMSVENFTGALDKAYVKDGIGGFDIWKLEDGLDADAPEYREMMDILGRAAYRSHLRNLLGPWYSDRSSYDWDGPTYVLLMFTDGQDRSITFSLDQKTLIVGRSWEERSYLYSLCNPQTILELDTLFQKYGTANEK